MNGRMPPAVALLGLGLGLALALTACATPLMGQHREAAPVMDSPDVCDPDAVAGGVPDRFTPVVVVLCDPALTILPAPTEEPVLPQLTDEPSRELSAPGDEPLADPPVQPRRFQGDLAALLAALAVPDQPLADGPCPAMMVYPPDVRLLDAHGRWIRAAIPRDRCHQQVREPVEEALARLTRVD